MSAFSIRWAHSPHRSSSRWTSSLPYAVTSASRCHRSPGCSGSGAGTGPRNGCTDRAQSPKRDKSSPSAMYAWSSRSWYRASRAVSRSCLYLRLSRLAPCQLVSKPLATAPAAMSPPLVSKVKYMLMDESLPSRYDKTGVAYASLVPRCHSRRGPHMLGAASPCPQLPLRTPILRSQDVRPLAPRGGDQALSLERVQRPADGRPRHAVALCQPVLPALDLAGRQAARGDLAPQHDGQLLIEGDGRGVDDGLPLLIRHGCRPHPGQQPQGRLPGAACLPVAILSHDILVFALTRPLVL